MTELKLGLKTQSPDFVVPWYRISHARRIWRWLVSRPPRVQTMASLTAALNYANDRSRSE
jgi:hypothetical protein